MYIKFLDTFINITFLKWDVDYFSFHELPAKAMQHILQ